MKTMQGRRMAAARQLAGFSTQAAAADRLGFHRQQLSRWERGKPIPLESLRSMAELYGASIDWILGHEPSRAELTP